MRVPIVCSWCNRIMRYGIGPASHGICPRCIRAHFPEINKGLAGRRVTKKASPKTSHDTSLPDTPSPAARQTLLRFPGGKGGERRS